MVDEGKPNHKNLPCGGTAILVLNPLNLGSYLYEINGYLEREYSDKLKLKDIIRKVRNSFLVHDDLSPSNLEELVTLTNMRDISKQALLKDMLWRLYHLVILLDLQIQAVMKELRLDLSEIVQNYLSSLSKTS